MQSTKDIIRQVKKIEISTKHLVDGIIAGNYHSIFKGQGIEFSEIRDYKPGDDIRAIDWKVTARFNHPYIKEFIEERDLRVYFAFDLSGSGNFGNKVEKLRRAIELTATLMFSAMRNNDNVGLFIITDRIERHIPARKGKRHVLKLLSTLVSFEPSSKHTNLHKTLADISNILKRRSVLFIVSDFISNEFSKPLSILKNRHDLIAIKLSDIREREIPDIGLIQLEDEETGEQILVDTSAKGFRERYSNIMKAQSTTIDHMLKKHKVDSVQINTEEPYDIPLKRFFKLRKRRVMA